MKVSQNLILASDFRRLLSYFQVSYSNDPEATSLVNPNLWFVELSSFASDEELNRAADDMNAFAEFLIPYPLCLLLSSCSMSAFFS